MPLSLLLLHVPGDDSSSFFGSTYVSPIQPGLYSTQMACLHARLTTSAVHLGTKPAASMSRAHAKQNKAGIAALPGQKDELQLPKVVEGSLLKAPPNSEARNQNVPCLLHSQLRSKPTMAPTCTQVPVLFHHFLCPYSQRSLLAFVEKGVEHMVVHVDLADKPRWYSRITSAGLVPAVGYEGQVHTESIDICRWVDETFNGPNLMAGSSTQRKAADHLISSCSGFTSAGLSLLGGSGRSWGIGRGQTESQRAAFRQELSKLEQALQNSGGPFLMGRSVSLVDLIYYPFAERFALAMPKFVGLDMRKTSQAVGGWLDVMEDRPAVQMASPKADLFLAALAKEQSLDFFDFRTYKANQLLPHINVSNS